MNSIHLLFLHAHLCPRMANLFFFIQKELANCLKTQSNTAIYKGDIPVLFLTAYLHRTFDGEFTFPKISIVEYATYINPTLSILMNFIFCQGIHMRNSTPLEKVFLNCIQQSLFGLTIRAESQKQLLLSTVLTFVKGISCYIL